MQQDEPWQSGLTDGGVTGKDEPVVYSLANHPALREPPQFAGWSCSRGWDNIQNREAAMRSHLRSKSGWGASENEISRENGPHAAHTLLRLRIQLGINSDCYPAGRSPDRRDSDPANRYSQTSSGGRRSGHKAGQKFDLS